MKKILPLGAVAAVLACGSAVHAQGLLVAESFDDRVLLLNSIDGSIIDENFIDIAAGAASVGYTGNITPIEPMQVGNEIWVSDQVADRVWRFNLDGTFAGQYGVDGTGQGLLNNVRGFEVVGNTAYFAQGSDGPTGGFGEGIVTMDITTGALTGVFANGVPTDYSYYDVKNINGQLFVTDQDGGNDAIEVFTAAGAFVSEFASSDGATDFDFAQQINVRGSNGNLLVGGFSAPSGVYEFMQDGTPLGIVPGTENLGPRAAWELANGNVLFAHGLVLNRTGAGPVIDGTLIEGFPSFRYINAVPFPAPGAAAAFGVFGLMSLRRRRA